MKTVNSSCNGFLQIEARDGWTSNYPNGKVIEMRLLNWGWLQIVMRLLNEKLWYIITELKINLDPKAFS